MNISHRTGRLSRRRAASRSCLPLLLGGFDHQVSVWRMVRTAAVARRAPSCGVRLVADKPPLIGLAGCCWSDMNYLSLFGLRPDRACRCCSAASIIRTPDRQGESRL